MKTLTKTRLLNWLGESTNERSLRTFLSILRSMSDVSNVDIVGALEKTLARKRNFLDVLYDDDDLDFLVIEELVTFLPTCSEAVAVLCRSSRLSNQRVLRLVMRTIRSAEPTSPIWNDLLESMKDRTNESAVVCLLPEILFDPEIARWDEFLEFFVSELRGIRTHEERAISLCYTAGKLASSVPRVTDTLLQLIEQDLDPEIVPAVTKALHSVVAKEHVWRRILGAVFEEGNESASRSVKNFIVALLVNHLFHKDEIQESFARTLCSVGDHDTIVGWMFVRAFDGPNVSQKALQRFLCKLYGELSPDFQLELLENKVPLARFFEKAHEQLCKPITGEQDPRAEQFFRFVQHPSGSIRKFVMQLLLKDLVGNYGDPLIAALEAESANIRLDVMHCLMGNTVQTTAAVGRPTLFPKLEKHYLRRFPLIDKSILAAAIKWISSDCEDSRTAALALLFRSRERLTLHTLSPELFSALRSYAEQMRNPDGLSANAVQQTQLALTSIVEICGPFEQENPHRQQALEIVAQLVNFEVCATQNRVSRSEVAYALCATLLDGICSISMHEREFRPCEDIATNHANTLIDALIARIQRPEFSSELTSIGLGIARWLEEFSRVDSQASRLLLLLESPNKNVAAVAAGSSALEAELRAAPGDGTAPIVARFIDTAFDSDDGLATAAFHALLSAGYDADVIFTTNASGPAEMH